MDAKNFGITLIQDRHMPIASLRYHKRGAFGMLFGCIQVGKFNADCIVKSVTINDRKAKPGHLTQSNYLFAPTKCG
jgi:hypothetical protein